MAWWRRIKKNEAQTAERNQRWNEAERVYSEALQNYQAGQFQLAIAKFEQARAIAHELNEIGPEAAALNDSGVTYVALKQYPKAIAAYENALSIRRSLPDKDPAADTLRNMVLLFTEIRDVDRALNCLQELASTYKELGDRNSEATALNDAGVHLTDLGRSREALQEFEVALSVFRNIQNQRMVAVVLNNKGRALSSIWRVKETAECWTSSFETFRNLNDETNAAQVQVNLGYFFYLVGEPQKSLDNLLPAISVLRRLNLTAPLAGALNNLGLAYSSLGEPQQALTALRESLDLRHAVADRSGETRTLNNMGLVFRDLLGAPDRALHYYREAAQILDSAPDRKGKAFISNNMGLAFLDVGNYDKALECFQKSHDLKEVIGDLAGQAHSLDNLGRVYLRLGQPERSKEFHKRAFDIEDQLEDRRFRSSTLYAMGNAVLAAGQITEASKFYAQGLEIQREIGDRAAQALSLYSLGHAASLLGRTSEARQNLQDAIAIFEAMQSTVLDDAIRSSFRGDMYDAYRALVGLLLDQYYKEPTKADLAAQAFAFAERGRARGLLYMLREAGTSAYTGADPTLAAQEQALVTSISAKIQRDIELKAKARHKWDSEQITEIEKELADLQQRYEQVREAIKLKNTSFHLLTDPLTLTLTQVQNALRSDGRVLLEYAMGRQRSYLFFVGPDDFKVCSLPAEDDLNSWVRRLLEKVRDPKAESYPEGYKLFEALIKPVVDYIEGKELLIVPDGLLHYLPFELLLTEPHVDEAVQDSLERSVSDSTFDFATLPYLINRFSIKYGPSATVLLGPPHNGSQARKYQHEFVGLAPVEFHFPDTSKHWFSFGTSKENFPRLQYTEEEVTAIRDLFASHKTACFLRQKATKNVLKDRQMTDSRFLHIATHGMANERQPFLSGILLTPESEGSSGFLSASEVLQMQLTCEMVALSACETGLGKLIKGEGIVGLTRALFFAGAKTLLVSLWRVDDMATSTLMKRLYQNLTAELGPSQAAALRKAKISLIEKARLDPKHRHLAKPYYWAPFVLID